MPKSEKQLIDRDKKRDIGSELLESVRQMKAGKRSRTHKFGNAVRRVDPG